VIVVVVSVIGLWILDAIREYRRHREETRQLWDHIQVLESDKRALTESLCRAQGRPYIRPKHDQEEWIPAAGWYDAPETPAHEER